MSLTSINFGDVFRFKEKDYIFLAKADQVVFVAQILDGQSTREIKSLYESKCRNGHIEKVKSNILYCFVELTTEDFKGRLAHFKDTERDDQNFFIEERYLTLDKTDQQELKKEIESKESSVPLLLKDLISKLDI
ncbi:MAG: hypothetical protein NTY66_00975 [Candidatus Vogelbacteria bacterium]|nr:hypothetical protein [Candidatus Vogelbacteria bacterium]